MVRIKLLGLGLFCFHGDGRTVGKAYLHRHNNLFTMTSVGKQTYRLQCVKMNS